MAPSAATMLIAATSAAIREHGDGEFHTVAAAVWTITARFTSD